MELGLHSDREIYANWIQYRIRFFNFFFQKDQNLNRLEILNGLLKNCLNVYMQLQKFILFKFIYLFKFISNIRVDKILVYSCALLLATRKDQIWPISNARFRTDIFLWREITYVFICSKEFGLHRIWLDIWNFRKTW